MAIMNKEEKKTENKMINEIDDSHEDEELENKKMDMFFSLIKNYREAKKRRRQELTQDSGDVASIPTKRSDSGIVPVFRPEDFSHCVDLNLKPSSNSISPTNKNQEQDEEEEEEAEDKEEEAEKEIREDNGLDLNDGLLDNGLDLNLAL
ncbi:PREDICTED: protein NIM1-INTERACTING 1-like [Camelina sativa]|uniref:Protein NIM1-INTERACTING 1-like n=1 Tax=Camelina sativa TaxID=90675 RepID=A0ABM0TNH0_CAMSA|nr:PREDICTED: protein NIM1-INTERACTING 1-like [Camelina sativa]